MSEFRFTNEEWRSYQQLPDQGYSHRRFLENIVNKQLANRPYWFRWFAWRPVWTFDRGWVWLRLVYKKHVPPKDVPGACWTFNYRVRAL